MVLTRILLLILAYSSTIFAQCDGITIRSSDDVDAISQCGTYNGDITIDESVSGKLAFTGISHLKGDLVCSNATQLTEISFHQLVTISGSFRLLGLTILSDLKFDSIMEVGDIQFIDLPALQALDFATGIVTADQVTISNTALRDLAGLEFSTCNSMDVSHNAELTSITLDDLTNTTNTISILTNGAGLEVSFRSLTTCRGMALQNVDILDVSLLDSVTGSLNLAQNTFRTFSAPSLTLVVDLLITDNSLLSNLDFPLLPEISGDLSITNNSRLVDLSGFPKLLTIVGDLNLTGRFSVIEFPTLSQVQGDSNVETSIDNGTVCALFDGTSETQIIEGLSKCTTGNEPPDSTSGGNQDSTATGSTASDSGGTSDSGSSNTDDKNSTSGISGGAIGGIVAGAVLLLTLAAGLWWWRRRGNQGRDHAMKLSDSTPELPLGGHHEKPELQGSESYGNNMHAMYELKGKPMQKSPMDGRAELGWECQIAEMEGSSVPEMSSNGR